MSLINKLKFATGLGLNAQEAYQRAYEKGVLLGRQNYAAAAEMFHAAADKFHQAGEMEAANRAMANRYIYTFLANGNLGALHHSLQHLQQVQYIEEFGSQTEAFQAAELGREIIARLTESRAMGESNDLGARAQYHREAARLFRELNNQPLRTYRVAPAEDGKSTPLERYFVHEGWASCYEAISAQAHNPDKALEHYSQAVGAFKRANMEDQFQRMNGRREAMLTRRACWVCHREMQGEDVHFTFAEATVLPYVVQVLQSNNQPTDSIKMNPKGPIGAIAVCTPCQTMIHNMADLLAVQRASEVEERLAETINELESEVMSLRSRINVLENMAHRH